MSIKKIINNILVKPPQVCRFDDALRTEPVSRTFGFDRGTPIDRYYIDRFLRQNQDDIHGAVLEVAESTYSRKFGSNVSSYEVLHYDGSNKNATIIGDLTRPETLPDGKIDCFICTQTLNFIYDFQSAVQGCYKLLTDGGKLLCTVAGLSQISRYDMDLWGDYWRFTDLSAKKLFGAVFGPENVEVSVYGNMLTAKMFLDGIACEDLPDKSVLDVQDNDYQIIIGIRAVKK